MDSMDSDVAAEQRAHNNHGGELEAGRHHVDNDLAVASECHSKYLKLLPQTACSGLRGDTPTQRPSTLHGSSI